MKAAIFIHSSWNISANMNYPSSSSVGSISLASQFQHLLTPSYKITKAALNALTVDYGLTYAKEGFTFIVISPGVSTSSPFHQLAMKVVAIYVAKIWHSGSKQTLVEAQPICQLRSVRRRLYESAMKSLKKILESSSIFAFLNGFQMEFQKRILAVFFRGNAVVRSYSSSRKKIFVW